MRFLRFCLLSSVLLTAACSQPQPAAESTATSPAAPAASVPAGSTGAPDTAVISWPAPFQPTTNNQCERAALRNATIYQRPGTNAPKFGQLMSGERVRLLARTADGWVGFDPATAQAANVGIFRLRWVRGAEVFGAADQVCNGLPLIQAPPFECLLMATHPVAVRSRPTIDAPPLSTIPTGSYARVRPEHVAKGWMEIEVPGKTASGYVVEADINLSGPCR